MSTVLASQPQIDGVFVYVLIAIVKKRLALEASLYTLL